MLIMLRQTQYVMPPKSIANQYIHKQNHALLKLFRENVKQYSPMRCLIGQISRKLKQKEAVVSFTISCEIKSIFTITRLEYAEQHQRDDGGR